MKLRWIIGGLAICSLVALPKAIPQITTLSLAIRAAMVTVICVGGIGCIFKGLVGTGIWRP